MAKSRIEKKQELANLKQQVANLQHQVDKQAKAESQQKVHLNLSVTKETRDRLQRFAEFKNTNISGAVTDWIWSTRFDKK